MEVLLDESVLFTEEGSGAFAFLRLWQFSSGGFATPISASEFAVKMMMPDLRSYLVKKILPRQRGIFPMYPTENGLLFVPLTFELPLAQQLRRLDALLHKATDEIIQIDASSDFSKGTVFSPAFCELKRNIEDMPEFCVLDPLNNIYPLLDRHMIQNIICKLDGFTINGQFKIRAPRFLKVDTFEISSLKDGLSEASLSFPVIVKPQVACGVSDAHDMALVFKIEDFENLFVPLPAVIQEYVDHGSWLFKFYVLGDKVFHIQ
ncbi:hypothetical protein HPP92_025046 [Vanilla planifolia]|uniref:inositol-1,3,4-trisphosphate 5/6-kinase n=1 Tax=Vanilla planifolia TaxID=51239 RepID=A0A835U9U5_VANPL|nr:hypothetical protein HPP92_025046 [Vanilla planifolia]